MSMHVFEMRTRLNQTFFLKAEASGLQNVLDGINVDLLADLSEAYTTRGLICIDGPRSHLAPTPVHHFVGPGAFQHGNI